MRPDLRRPAARPRLDPDRFRTPHATDRPGFRWWWTVPVPIDELVRELRAMHAAGIGEVEIAFSPGFWADEPQRAALAAVLAEAERLGVGVAATVGAAWPLQTPNTTRGTEHAARELQYGVAHVPAGTRGVRVPPAFDDEGSERGARLHAVVAARILTAGDPPPRFRVRDWHGERLGIGNPERSTILDADSLVVLAADDTVDLPPGDGDWAVFGLWLRDCAQGVTSFLDRDAAVAATQYLDEHQFGPENLAAFGRTGTEWFEDSLELNADSLFWTDDLLARFEARFGYDLTPHLPVLFVHGMCRYWVPNSEPTPDFAYPDSSDARVRRDYHRLITDLYVADHLLVLQDWSARHGVRHKAQAAYGQNLEPIRSNRDFVRAGGRAEGESLNAGDRFPVTRSHPSWRFALDWARCIVGGAHQGGATRVSTELGAQFAASFAQTLGDLKQVLDKEWAAGITKPFVHGFAVQPADAPWPTQSRFADIVTESWNDLHYPEWVHLPALADYWARGTLILETGTPRTDVAIHRDGFLTTAARGTPEQDRTAPARLADTEALERRGYSVQFVDPIGLAEPEAFGAAGDLFPNGPAYRALILDERTMMPEAIEAVAAAAGRGLRVIVVGEPPASDSGFAHGDAGHRRVREAVAQLLTLPTVARVAEMRDAAGALAGLGLVPRAAWNGPLLLTQWREAGDLRFVLVYHTDAEAVTVRLSLEGEGAVSELDLWTGGIRPLGAAARSGRTEVTLSLEPLGVRVLALHLGASTAEVAAPEPAWAPVTLGPWHLTARTEEPLGSRTIELDRGPADWRQVPELADAAGVATYTTTVTAHLDRSRLELGALVGSASVRVDGVTVGTAFTSGAVLDLGDALRAGGTLEVVVATPLHNAVLGVDRPSPPGLPLPGRAGNPLPQGWVGPARLLGT